MHAVATGFVTVGFEPDVPSGAVAERATAIEAHAQTVLVSVTSDDRPESLLRSGVGEPMLSSTDSTETENP